MPNLDSLRRRIADLNDEALLEVDPAELTDEARAVYEEELASRDLAWPSTEAQHHTAPSAPVSDPSERDPESIPDLAPDDLVTICRFESVAEASFAISLLRQEKIPIWIGTSPSRSRVQIDPNAPFDIHTLPEYAEAAQLLISSDFSDEELARLAEEAGEAS